MGLFGLSKKEKEAWIAIVIQGKKSGMQIDEALLKNATEIYITQHIRILEDSVRIVMESKIKRQEKNDMIYLYSILMHCRRFKSMQIKRRKIGLLNTGYFQLLPLK